MSDETVCDICGEVCGQWDKKANTKVPFRYRVWERVARRSNYDKYSYVEKDLCKKCRRNMEGILVWLSKEDKVIDDLLADEDESESE